METYKIIRFYQDSMKQGHIIKRHLTLKEARAHCKRKDTHGKTSDGSVVWFDGYEQE